MLRKIVLAAALAFAASPALAAEACDGPETIKQAIMAKKGASFIRDITEPDEIAALASDLEANFVGFEPGDSYMLFGRDQVGLVFVSIINGCPAHVYTVPLPGVSFPKTQGV